MRPPSDDGDERAPLLGSWARWYLLVLATLTALVTAFAALSRHYR